MRSTRLANRHFRRPLYYSLFLLLTLLLPAVVARAADDETDEPDEYDVTARVVRISLLTGEVNLSRAGKTAPERARLNLPLVEGDILSTGREARVEIQIDARNFIRLGENSILKIVTLRDEGIALSVVEGTASVRLAKFDHDRGFFEIDAPKTTLTVEKSGLYRIDVGKDGHVRLTARAGGRARIYSETSGFALRDGRSAELIIDGADAGEWEMLQANKTDSWDDWIDGRERSLAQRLHYENKYYDEDLWGAEDLDSYGAWTYADEYGWIWRPNTSVISSYNDWAPYRYGEWTWLPPYGWTWVGNEPWGWAPYHYGRWVYYNNYWAWVPHTKNKARRSWWRPALVAFLSIDFSFGNEICWYPLSYHDRDPRSRNYRHDRDDRGSGHDRDDHRDWREHRWRGVTAVPTRDFGAPHPHRRPIDERLARRIAGAQPLGDVPVRPARETNRRSDPTERRGQTGGDDRRRAQTNGEDRRRDWSERRTGAANRNPGVALDSELRRTRIWNGREARPQFPVASGGAGGIETTPTGAVSRPTRPTTEVDPAADPAGNSGSDTGNTGGRERNRNRERGEGPWRSNRTTSQENVPAPMGTNEPERAPTRFPVRQQSEPGVPADTPVRPEGYHRPAVSNGERPDRADRNDRHERSNDSSPRPERSGRNREPDASEPRHNDQPPRSEPVRERSEPTRHEAAPQRSEPRQEAPRNDPPAHSEPRNDPPQHSEPAPQHSEPAPPPSEPAKSDPPARESPQVEPPRQEHGNRKDDPR